jgi:hypothetical protein
LFSGGLCRQAASDRSASSATRVNGIMPGEVILRTRWLPLAILVVFLLISVTALSGVGRNIAQKRDAYSDPLCKAFWDKTPQAVSNMSARIEGRQKRNEKERFSTGHKPYPAIGKNLSNKYRITARSGTNQSMKTPRPAPITSGSMILPRLPHFKTVWSRKPDISA